MYSNMLSLSFSLSPNSYIILTNKNQYNSRAKFPKILATAAATTSSSKGDNLDLGRPEVALPKGLKRELMPNHVAVIMDGHRRWARRNGLSVEQGHLAGVEKMKVLTRLCSQWGVKVLTVFIFSTENWIRPKEEVDFLMKLFLDLATSQEYLDDCTSVEQGHLAGGEKMKVLTRLCSQWGVKVLTLFAFSTENWSRPKVEVDFLMKLFLDLAISQENLDEWTRNNGRVFFIGDKSLLSKPLRKAFTVLEEKTKSNSGLDIMIAINYSGRHDIVRATKSIASKVNNGHLAAKDIDERHIEQELETHCVEFPEPDLLIRTSGEQRVSNFMLWQLAYTELYFANKLFPDMEEVDFIEALMSFQQRQRRYGGSHKI